MNRLPKTFDLTPTGDIVKCAKIGEEGYAENVQYTLITDEREEDLILGYYGEDDSIISIDTYFQLIEDYQL